MTAMRKIIAAVAVVIGLTFGMAAPASAHHTHSPTTLCSYYRPGGYTMLTPHSHYSVSGHPTFAHCYYRSNTTFSLYQTCRSYDNHYMYSLSVCGHG